MDFIEFAEQYKIRTAKRMMDFEAAIRESRRQMEQTARHQQLARELNLKRPTDVPLGAYRPQRNRRVQGVLRREEPGAET
ncbi:MULTISPECIES: hypothetical protein [unclassified Corynebacterium]|uniref:hypothetical protein n=1 Tax=unclassified Corynebacterium TaxID=2624378 RepID=UPI002A90A41C|nr:hypothetical protein [Corynebacterium sp.]MDY5785881.1 hypothetical protein [Corynebacterium sp.]